MNFELTRYMDVPYMSAAWAFGPEFQFSKGKGIHPLDITAKSDKGDYFLKETAAINNGDPEFSVERGQKNAASTALALHGIYGLMKQGPVIIRPSVSLALAMADTTMNFSYEEFKMPFKYMGVELPVEIAGPHFPALTIIYQPIPAHVFVCTLSRTASMFYHTLFGKETDTFEETLVKREECDDENEYRIQVVGTRIAVNLCMLATCRQTRVEPYDRKVERHRRAHDDRLNQLAGRVLRELTFRDLVLIDRSHDNRSYAKGERQGKQYRRGHWRNVAHGPKFSKHTRKWISDYETHKDDDQTQTIILQ